MQHMWQCKAPTKTPGLGITWRYTTGVRRQQEGNVIEAFQTLKWLSNNNVVTLPRRVAVTLKNGKKKHNAPCALIFLYNEIHALTHAFSSTTKETYYTKMQHDSRQNSQQ